MIENIESKYVCFIDQNSLILGYLRDGRDWITYLKNEFERNTDIGAISPLVVWENAFKCNTLNMCCMFTSKKVLETVGNFDNNVDSSKGIDWSIRCQKLGFKINKIDSSEFPFYCMPVVYELVSKEIIHKYSDKL